MGNPAICCVNLKPFSPIIYIMLNNAKVIQFFFKAISYYDQFWTYTLILPGNRSFIPHPGSIA